MASRPLLIAVVLLVVVFMMPSHTEPVGPSVAPAAAPRYAHVQLMQLAAMEPSNGTDVQSADPDDQWSKVVLREATPVGEDPADYGANADGERWEDAIMQSKQYELAKGATITTHTHGIVIIATESITINGRINAHNLGAQPGEPGYPTTRAATMNLYRGYGETDPQTGEPQLWGSGAVLACAVNVEPASGNRQELQPEEIKAPSDGSDACDPQPPADCGPDYRGGGYIILHAPSITLNGDLDAGSDCGQAGIVILEGNVTGTGIIEASQIINRGA